MDAYRGSDGWERRIHNNCENVSTMHVPNAAAGLMLAVVVMVGNDGSETTAKRSSYDH